MKTCLALLLTVALSACTDIDSGDSGDPNDINAVNGEWAFAAYSTALGGSSTSITSDDVTIDFDVNNRSYAANFDCLAFDGSIVIESNVIVFDDFLPTLSNVDCNDSFGNGLLDLDVLLDAVSGASFVYELVNGELRIIDILGAITFVLVRLPGFDGPL